MPERSSDGQLYWISRVGLLLTVVALTYYLTWYALTSHALTARWLAPAWVVETYSCGLTTASGRRAV